MHAHPCRKIKARVDIHLQINTVVTLQGAAKKSVGEIKKNVKQ